MLTLEHGTALCDLTEKEAAAVAAHERSPRIVAAEPGNDLIRAPDGVPAIKPMILHDIAAARAGATAKTRSRLREGSRHFVETRPDGGVAAAPHPDARTARTR